MTDDKLVAAYLNRLRRAARRLPAARRKELLGEIATHIAEARAAEVAPVRDVLAALGEPHAIAAAAGGTRREIGGREIATLALLLGGAFLAGLGWVAGLVLLWTSSRWRWPDRLLGTLVWPAGFAGPLYLLLLQARASVLLCRTYPGGVTSCEGSGRLLPWWPLTIVLVIAFAAPVAMAIRLVISGRRLPDQAEPRLADGALA
jgi:hypothetical protein